MKSDCCGNCDYFSRKTYGFDEDGGKCFVDGRFKVKWVMYSECCNLHKPSKAIISTLTG